MNGEAHPLLEVRDLVAGYLPDVDVLHGCDIDVAGGEIVGIIGPNGAGKSTLIKAVFGLVPVRAGSVQLRGADIAKCPPHELVRQGVGYVPQLSNVFTALTVAENLRMGIYLRARDYHRRQDELFEHFPRLGQRREQRAGSLSGGERQMLAMARAMMTEPSVILLDEPSAGLSPIMQDEVFERIAGINRAGVSILIVEQNVHRCLEIAHRGYVLDQGRNAYTGTGTELMNDPKVVELYLGTLARARPRAEAPGLESQ
jgi:branched-chain amino acid transport system ATP-binding protein